jgi:hypothetical protein
VRPAKDADAADHKYPASYLDWWRLHAVDPRTGRYLLIRIQTNSGRSLSAVVFDGHRWYGGVLQVEDPWEAATLERVRRGWKLDLNGSPPPVKGSLRLTGRPGVTVGPWRLGLQVTYTNTPPWEHGSLTWSALVPAGRLDGWVEFESLRVDIRGWRGYLDHTWGRMHLYSTAYQHWDFGVTHPRPGESWILHGLEPRPGGPERPRTWTKPNDRLWQGVLVHATPRGVTTCRPRIARSGWFTTYRIGLGSGGPYPAKVTATCGRKAITIRRWHADFRWNDEYRTQYWIGSGPTPNRAGFIQHILPEDP